MKRALLFLIFISSFTIVNAGFVFRKPPSDFISNKEEVICLIYHKDKQLFLLKSPFAQDGNQWVLPRTQLQEKESYYKAVHRFLGEELKLNFSSADLIYLEKVYFVYPSRQSSAHVFQISLRSLPEKIKLSMKEYSQYKFIKESEREKIQLFPGENECLEFFQKKKKVLN